MVGAPSVHSRRFVAALAAGLLGLVGVVVGAPLPAGVAHALPNCALPGPVMIGDVYQVSTPAQLAFIAATPACLDESFLQTAAIDLSGYVPWVPIGNASNPFMGTFDGGGYAITGVTINVPSGWYVGLFGYIRVATVRNVNVTATLATGGRVVGALAGYASSSTVSNSHATGTVTSTNPDESRVGGLVGEFEGTSEITGSSADVVVTGTVFAGGLVGVSGIGTVISRSYVTGDVTGNKFVGGLVGSADGTHIADSYSSGSVRGTDSVGGLVGSAKAADIADSYSSGSVSGTSSSSLFGGLVGYASTTTFSSSFWDTSVSGTDRGVGAYELFPYGVTGLPTAGMKLFDTFGPLGANWAIVNGWASSDPPAKVWGICAARNAGYPYLLWTADGPTSGCPAYDAPTVPPASVTLVLNAKVGAELGTDATMVQVDGEGLLPGSTYEVVVHSTAQTIATGEVGSDGSFSQVAMLPAGLEPDSHSVTVNGVAPDGFQRFATSWFSVTQAGVVSAVSDMSPIPQGLGFVALAPVRVLDTRDSGVMPSAGSVTELSLAGLFGVPSDAVAVALNVTVDQPAAAGFVTVYPCGTVAPTASNVNYAAGETTSNAVTAYLGDVGKICIFTMSPAHLVIDVNGAYNQTSRVGLVPGLFPTRLFDSRDTDAMVAAGTVHQLAVVGSAGVPEDATAVVLNVTVDQPSTDGFVTVYPCGTGTPVASNVNFVAGETTSNSVVVSTGTGTVCIFTMSTTHVIVDVTAAYSPTANSYMMPSDIARLVDTRETVAAVETGSVTEIVVAGQGNLDAAAVVLNIAVDQPTAAGFLTIYPCGIETPSTSNLTFIVGQTTSNAVTVAVGTEGKVCVYSTTGTHLIIDANASFSVARNFT